MVYEALNKVKVDLPNKHTCVYHHLLRSELVYFAPKAAPDIPAQARMKIVRGLEN